MHCPVCNARCSVLRDVCPNCFFDIRESKKLAGLTVTFPNLDFHALIQKYNLEKAFAEYQSTQPEKNLEPEKPLLATEQELNTITSELKGVVNQIITEEKSEAKKLFQEAFLELKKLPPSNEIDLSNTLAISPRHKETIRALFQIVEDELTGHALEKQTALISSTERKIESEILEQRLEEVETAVSDVSVAPKKLSDLVEQQKALGVHSEEPLPQTEAPLEIQYAPLLRRISACLIDWGVAFVLSCVTFLFYDQIEEKGYFVALAAQSYDLIDWTTFVYGFLITFFIVLPSYGVVSYVFSKGTIGESLCQLVLRSKNKFKRVTPFQHLLRGLLLPLYFLIIPGILRLFSKKTLIDWITGTEIKFEHADFAADSKEFS